MMKMINKRFMCLAITAMLLFSSALAMINMYPESEPDSDVSEITCILPTKRGNY
jgi:hypothetical protein